ncbi:MAG: alpha/beta hydrolase [Humidesulfovibrio sp.]|nr:alpha/beta hydrolase [Humidesulfovibrio sp.]
MIGLIFLHGWGYGPETWDDWAKVFGAAPVVVLDAGYFSPRRMALPDDLHDNLQNGLPENPDGWVGVGHSLGFARLLEMGVPWRGLVGVSGFLRFCRKPDATTGTPPEIHDAMLHRLDVAPEDVLARFHRRCGHQRSGRGLPLAGGLARLRTDLLHLRDLDMRGMDLRPDNHLDNGPAKRPVPTLLIQALDDRIAPPELAGEAHTLLPGSRLELLETGGHALPMTRSQDCLRLLRGFLHDLG